MATDSTRPVDRVRAIGPSGASPIDLVAVGYSRREEDANANEMMAREMLQRYGSIQALGEASPAELKEHTGLETFEVLRVQALIELGRRWALAKTEDKKEISTAKALAKELRWMGREKKEHFVAMLLDAKNNLLKQSTIHIGTLTMSVVGPREIFREAIREGASSIIIAHNHPSGDVTPSPEDLQVTRKLVDIGAMLDIPVVDHVIIGEYPNYLSFAEKGLL